MSFDLHAKFDLDGSGFEKGAKQIEGRAQEMAHKVTSSIEQAFSGDLAGSLASKAAGAFGLGAIFGTVIAGATKMADEVKERVKDIAIGSTLLQVDPQTFQRVKNVTEGASSSTEAVAKAFEHIAEAQEAIKSNAPGADKAVEQFAKLGISLRDLNNSNQQEIFFKIAEGLRSGVVSGEQLAALKERLGKGGPGLLAAFKVGFDSEKANKGLIDSADIDSLNAARKVTAEMKGDLSTVTTYLGVIAAESLAGLQKLVSIIAPWKLLVIDPARWLGRLGAPSDKATLQQLDTKARGDEAKKILDEQFAEEKRLKYQADQDAELADKRKKKEQEDAGKQAEKLDEENAKRQKEIEFNKLSPEAKRDFLRKSAETEGQLAAEFNQRFLQSANGSREGGADETLHREAAGHRALQLEAESKLAGLTKPGASDQFHIEDRLARIGGGFSDTNNTRPLLERTARGIETLVQQGSSSGDSNPLKGS